MVTLILLCQITDLQNEELVPVGVGIGMSTALRANCLDSLAMGLSGERGRSEVVLELLSAEQTLSGVGTYDNTLAENV
jgi:hypothetical protein